MFIGRKEELDELTRLYNSPKFEFGYIYGQRRIGKTTLVDEFARDKKSLVFFAADSDDVTIRNDFSRVLTEKTGLSGANYNTWDDFFLAVSNYFGSDYGVMVIDEYPNIVLTRDGKRKRTDFVSKLQNYIDRIFKNQKFLLILTGSNVSFMEKEVKDTKAPLYQRNTFELMLTKLEWNDAVKLLGNIDNNEKIKIMCLTDTFPFYISNIDTNTSFEENLERLFFAKTALFTNDPSSLLSSEIVTSGLYSGIMRKISSGCNTVSALAKTLSTDTATISMYLEKLIENKVVSKHYVFKSKRNTYYKITDRMMAFYFRFIASNAEMIKLGYGKAIFNNLKNAIDDFVHHSFEDLCITYLSSKSKNMELNGLFMEFQNYKVENSTLNRSVEIDIISEDDNKLLVGECKLTKNKKSVDVLEKMKENTSIDPFKNYKHIDYYIFSTAGFSESLLNSNDCNVHLIDLKKMLTFI